MIEAIVLGFILIGLSTVTHFFILSHCYTWIETHTFNRYLRILATVYAAVLGQFISAGLFAVGFAQADSWGLGSFDSGGIMTAMDYFYFSLVNMTTLGLGQIFPTGHLRFLAGLEAMNGFILISCSAAYIFKVMHSNAKDAP